MAKNVCECEVFDIQASLCPVVFLGLAAGYPLSGGQAASKLLLHISTLNSNSKKKVCLLQRLLWYLGKTIKLKLNMFDFVYIFFKINHITNHLCSKELALVEILRAQVLVLLKLSWQTQFDLVEVKPEQASALGKLSGLFKTTHEVISAE